MTVPGSNRQDQPKGVWIRATYFWVFGALVILLLGAGTYVFSSAIVERNARFAQLGQMAARLSTLLDREVETARARLVGLSTSPALLDDDLSSFHQQMLRTPIPKGTVLAISDKSRQLANAATPFGTELPKLSAYTPQPQFFERLEAEGSYVSSRVYGPVAKIHAVTVSAKVPDADGQLKYILTTAILGSCLGELMYQAENPLPGGSLMLFDAMWQELTGIHGADAFPPKAEPIEPNQSSIPSAVPAHDEQPALMASYNRSASTGWTIAVTASQEWANGPLTRARQIVLLMCAFVAALAALTVLILRNRVSRPYQAMAQQLLDARREVAQIDDTLVVARHQEQRRIAQELHDTTAQKLVAADLYLQSISRALSSTGDKTPLSDARGLLSQALDELRTFCFLLRPDQLPDKGFRDYFGAIVQGFCDRAGLKCGIALPEWSDNLDEESQSLFLRITRETLSNIYRHASAKSVSVRITLANGTYVLTIDDDGVGGVSFPSGHGQSPIGLGIRGMAETLAERSGRLIITPLDSSGTRLVASLPVTHFERCAM